MKLLFTKHFIHFSRRIFVTATKIRINHFPVKNFVFSISKALVLENYIKKTEKNKIKKLTMP